MRKLFAICVLMFLNIQLLTAGCLESLSSNILDLGGFTGVDSVVVKDQSAFVSLNFELSNNRYDYNDTKIDLHGLAKIDISDLRKFKKYDYNNYIKDENGTAIDSKYYQTKYLEDISNIVKFYLYGKDFTFGSNTLGQYSMFLLTNIKEENGDTIAYGYTNDKTNKNTYLWRINLSDLSNIQYKKYENMSIKGATGDETKQYYLVKKYSSDEANIIKADLSSSFLSSIANIYILDETNTSDYIRASIVGNNNNLFVQINKNVYQIDIANNPPKVETISNQISNINKLIYAKCSYLFYSSNFENLSIVDLDTNSTSTIKTWDPYNAIMINNMLYMTNMGAMVNAIDVSDPSNPIIESNTTQWGHTDDLFAKDGKLYVARGWAGLLVYDISECQSGVSDIYSNCSNDTNTTTPQTKSCSCFDINDINSLPSGWSLVGSGCAITNLDMFDNIGIVWYWDNIEQKWLAYSHNITTKTAIENLENVQLLNKIDSKKGFWIYK